ncbi:DUF1127 domain-containing protein [Pseudorhodoplanes sinuspersici]|nr:DUF1127 domain-containing protein [Pseudorhodoplanes sinuspersici]
MIVSLAAIAERRRQRRSLANLNDHLLRDIGITRYDAEQEIKKLF